MKSILTMILSLSLLLAPVAMARDSSADWRLLQAISSGQRILVKTSAGESLEGLFFRAGDSALEMNLDGKRVELQSTEVSRVCILRGRQFVKGGPDWYRGRDRHRSWARCLYGQK
jgi:hypothetical protein